MRFLFFLAVLFSLPAYAQSGLKDEWIFKRSASFLRTPWKEIFRSIPRAPTFVRSFGPENQYGLFRGKRPKKTFFPPGISVQPNFRYRALDASDPEVEKSWGLRNTAQQVGTLDAGTKGADVGAFEAWEIFTGSKEVVVAVLDTGIDFSHEDLTQNSWRNPHEEENGRDDDGDGLIDDITGWNFISHNNQTQDDSHHGTFCAGIIGADAGNGKGSRGLNWQVSMMAVKVLNEDGIGTTEQIISGIEYAVKHGARILNASFGGTSYDVALYETVKWAGEQGTLFVASSGNFSANNDEGLRAVYPASFSLPNILSVAAYDNRDQLAMLSNYGKKTTHLGAPGLQIYSTIPGGYSLGNGTSFAAPYVTGTAALLWGYVPSLSLSQLRERILQTSAPLHYYEKERLQTGGRISAWNALKNERPPRPVVPTQWERHPYLFSTRHPYANYESASLKIHHPGATHLRVHFQRFETEAGYDKMTLRDGNGKYVDAYSGEKNGENSADALGEILQIDFLADYNKSAYGVDIDYYEVSVEP